MSEEKMFEQEIAVGNYKMLLTRSAADDGAELILTKVWPTWAFGDWRALESLHADPKIDDVEAAVGTALSRHLEKPSTVRRAALAVAQDGEISVKFIRVDEPVPAGNVKTEKLMDPSLDKASIPNLLHPKDPEDVGELADLRRWRHKQEELASEADEARAEWEASEEDAELAKKKAKAAEATYQEIMTRLRRSILAEEEDHPLFKANGHATAKAKAGPASESPTDEEWKKTPLADLGLSKAILSKLEDGWCKPDDKPVALTTVGQLAGWIEKMGQRNFTDPLAQLKGVGAKAAETITAALDDFWAKQAQKATPVTVEADGEKVETTVGGISAMAEAAKEPAGIREVKKKRGRPKKLKGGTNAEGPIVPPPAEAAEPAGGVVDG